MTLITYGSAPVPWTVSFSAEQPYFVDRCPYAKRAALRQPQCRGGKPDFKNPNFDRQRKTIILDLCDLCAKPLKASTKVSLSMPAHNTLAARHGGTGILQVEPMMHRECALICLDRCPHLIRAAADGRLQVRQVTRWRPQVAIMSPDIIAEKVPDYTGPRHGIVGYAKVELLQWIDRDADWLRAA